MCATPVIRETESTAAIEPLRHNGDAEGWGSNGASFGLALTKALAKANRADFSLKSGPMPGP